MIWYFECRNQCIVNVTIYQTNFFDLRLAFQEKLIQLQNMFLLLGKFMATV